MKFLIKLLKHLIKSFLNNDLERDTVNPPDKIGENELLVRGIVRPLFHSRNKITDNAFLPPPKGRKDVSVLRHDYTDDNFCKNHAANLTIRDNNYCGLALLLAGTINDINTLEDYYLENGEKINVSVIATPILEKGLPMHADILYSHTLDDDEPKTIIRKIARTIRNKAKYLNDPFPNELGWKGEEIKKSLFK